MNFPIRRKCLEKSFLEMVKNETFLKVNKHLNTFHFFPFLENFFQGIFCELENSFKCVFLS